jgi:transposase
MKLHANAALTLSGRRLLAERVLVEGWTLTAAAEAAGVSVRCARKWVGRYRLAGDSGLADRSSAPRQVANRTAADRVAVIVKLRQLRMAAAEIAETLAMPLSTVSVVLRRNGLGRLGRIGLEQPVRYERSRPGELVHIDVKKLGRIEGGAGWRVPRPPPALQPHLHRQGRLPSPHRRLGVRPHRRRRPQPTRLRRGPLATRKPRPLPPSWLEPSPSTGDTASRSSACSPTTAAPTAASSTPSPAAASAYATSAPAPIDHRQTGKQSASSAPCSTAGPTAPSTAQAPNAPPHLTAGSGTTTTDADTQPSATNPRSTEPTCLGLTPAAVEGGGVQLAPELLNRPRHVFAEEVLDDPDLRVVVEREIDVLVGDEVD